MHHKLISLVLNSIKIFKSHHIPKSNLVTQLYVHISIVCYFMKNVPRQLTLNLWYALEEAIKEFRGFQEISSVDKLRKCTSKSILLT